MASTASPSFNRLDRAWFDITTLLVVGLSLYWMVNSLAAGANTAGAEQLLLPALLLVMGVFAGRIAERIGLPKLTGYILLGALIGPDAGVIIGQADLGGLITDKQLEGLKPVKDLAIGVIALMAGCEIRFSWLRRRWRSILIIVGCQALVIPPMIIATSFLPISLPFFDSAIAEGFPLWPVLLLAGSLALVSSPMVVVSVIKESRAKGALSETAMGVAVLKDVIVLLAFSLLMAVLVGMSHDQNSPDVTPSLATVGMKETLSIAWSILLGVGIGYILYRYTEATRHRISWSIIGLAVLVALLEKPLHVEPLFCLLAAGFACENCWPHRSERAGHHLEQALGRVALPVFVIFFIVAGLGLDLHTLTNSLLPVLWFVGARATAIWMSVSLGARLAQCEAPVRTWCWTAMIPQAGVTLALVIVVGDQFPGWGARLRDTIIAAIAIHELCGPVLLSLALRRTGEVNQAES